MGYKVEKSVHRLVHVITICLECDFTNEDYIKGESEALKHARATGHTTKVELGIVYTINKKHGQKTT